MFGRKKMYKKGLADAMQAYEGFGKKQKEAVEKIREEVRLGRETLETAIKSFGEDLNGVYEYLDSEEKAALYRLSTPLDIKELGDEEKRLLLAMLYHLANEEGSLKITPEQQGYLRSVQRYLEITNPQTETDLSAIEGIDSLEVQKVFMQVALEFFYLQEGDELSADQEEFLNTFSVSGKQAVFVEGQVSRLFNAVGPQGLAEKYGFMPEIEEPEQEQEGMAQNCDSRSDFVALREELADRIFGNKEIHYAEMECVETEHFCLANPRFSTSSLSRVSFSPRDEDLFRMDKTTGELRQLSDIFGSERVYPVKMQRYEAKPDNVVLEYKIGEFTHIGFLDLQREQIQEIDSGKDMHLLCTKDHYVVYSLPGLYPEIYVYDEKTKKKHILARPEGDAYDRYNGQIAAISENYLYLSACEKLCRVDLCSMDTIQSVPVDTSYFKEVAVVGTTLFWWADDGGYTWHNTIGRMDIEDSFTTLLKGRSEIPGYKDIIRGKLNRWCRIFNDDWLIFGYEEGGIWALNLADETPVKLVESYHKAYGFSRLGDWIYFRRGAGPRIDQVSKVNLNHPMQIEAV